MVAIDKELIVVDPLFEGFSEEAITMCLESDLWKLIEKKDEHNSKNPGD